MYNIGTIHTQLGAKTERTSADGMKMACSHFQCAAGAFEHLQNMYPQPPGVDMTIDLMKFMNQLCLAQAQECILEKSMLDHRKPTIVSKVAKQIVDYYALALRTLEPTSSDESSISETVGSKIYKSWKNYVTFKRSYYMSVTYLYQGLAAEEQQKMGERVAYYNAALTSLNTARAIHIGVKTSTGITGMAVEKEAIEDSLVFTNDVIEGKKKAATNENDFIYHEEVPEKDALPTVKGASLVKGISFSVNDPDISGPDIFARLVPMKVHEASSLYSEEKAKILRSVGSKIEEKNQYLETYLASLKLQHLPLWDPDHPVNDEYFSLPEELVERCALLNAKPTAIQELEEVMEKLSSTYGDVETMLNDIVKLLKVEEQKEKQYQDAVGKRPPTIVATDLTREAKKYEEAHAKASESNQALHRAMSLHLNNLRILEQPLSTLISNIPSIESMNTMSEIDKQNARELKRILAKVEQMQRQRGELHSQLRDSISQDNLTRLLLTATSELTSLDILFAEQLEKHKALVNLIDQNLGAQENILTALTDAYAKTAVIRKSVDNIIKQRDLMISSLMSSYDAYEDLLMKSSKGLEFYRKLEVNVTKLLQRVKSTCRVQEEEREQILLRDDKQPDIYSSKGVSIVSVGPTPEKKIGSGMKLRDHLSSRLKINSDKSSFVSTTQIQPNTFSTDSTLDFNSGEDINNCGTFVHSIDTRHQDPQLYQQYNYNHQSYYLPQTNQHSVQPYSNYDARLSTSYMANQSLPHSRTTNTSNMYQQAGGISSTNVSSDSTAYANSNIVHSNATHYPVSGYENLNYAQYNQGYQMPEISPSSQNDNSKLSQNYQSNEPSPHNLKSISESSLERPHTQETLPQLFNNISQQYNPTITDQSHVHGTNSSNNYPASQIIPPVNQTYAIPHESLNMQYINPNTQQDITANTYLANTNSVKPEQGSNYSSIGQQQHYYGNDLNTNQNISQSSTYAVPIQQAYVETSQSNIAPSPYLPLTNQKYSNTYVQSHLPMSVPSEPGNVLKEMDIIQSHAKSVNNIQVPYTTGSRYSIQSHHIDPVHPTYPTYLPHDQQIQPIHQGSYQGHPGYTYDRISGGYQYSSGYQNSQINQEHVSIDQQNGQSSGLETPHYSCANNSATTNMTVSSQYSLNSKYQPEFNDINYYATPYGIQQVYDQVSTNTNIQTNPGNAYTYIQSSDNKTTTTSSKPQKVEKTQSNLDLLAGLDITINHAPLLPEIQSTDQEKNNHKTDEKDSTSSITEISPEVVQHKTEASDESESGQINEKHENLQIVWDTWYNDVQPKHDPLGDPLILQKFIIDIEKYEKFVDSLTVKTLNGSTNLDIKWKEIREFEEREFMKQTSEIAKMNLDKNRTIDWIPYDSTRVKLSSAEQSSCDYINASHIQDLTQWTPSFIVTQAPMPQTFEAFWTMIWEQGTEVIASLSNTTDEQENIYWPTSSETPLIIGNFILILKDSTKHTNYVQRVIRIVHNRQNTEKVTVHMHFISWPSTRLPDSPGTLLSFATDIMSEQALRHCPNPIIVHCSVGGPLSGLFLLAAATVCHVRAGHGIADVPLIFSTLVKNRKCLIDRESLLFGYQMVLYHAQDILMKRNINFSILLCSFDL